MATYAIVKNAAGGQFLVSNSVKNSAGTPVVVNNDVNNSAGTGFTVFAATVSVVPQVLFTATPKRRFVA